VISHFSSLGLVHLQTPASNTASY